MAIIQVTPEMLRAKAGEVRSIKSNHDNIVNQITSLVRNLNSQWKGAAQDTFLARYNEFNSTTFVTFTNMLEGYAKLMDTAANELENQDTSLSNSTMNSFS